MTRLICLRDDDTSFHTRYEELADGYGEFWGKIPVTLATVPFSHGSQQKILEFEYPSDKKYQRVREWELKANADELTEYHKLHPIGENMDLVEKLKPLVKSKKIEIAQHGISHRYNEKGAEMFYDNVGLIQIRDGKEYLSKVFDTEIKVFVPPSNTIDYRCAKYINSLGVDILSGSTIKYRNNRQRIIDFLCHPIDIYSALIRRITGKAYPAIYKKCGIYITSATTFDACYTVDEIMKKVTDILRQNQAVVITTHYMLLNGYIIDNFEYRRKFQEFLGRLCQLENVEFVTASEYINRVKVGL